MSAPDPARVHAYLSELQARICAALEAEDDGARFSRETFEDPGGTLAAPRVLEGGALIEKAAVNFTHGRGARLPAPATAARPELAGAAFEAVSLSLIVHPRNPYVPTTHMNLRLFTATPAGKPPVWWFGGGFDLTPYYGFDEDCVHWHEHASKACAPLGRGAYARFKKECDAYFHLKHRGEPRGIGGTFFDDLAEPDFETVFAFVRSHGEHFLAGYVPIVARRKATPYGERERDFQLWRRGRYVEFNLIYDRGTKYGIESGRRIESVLASMPPEVRWRYDWHPQPGSPEARLFERYLVPRDWVDPEAG
jgi:coproporphyrinogen III oxidase